MRASRHAARFGLFTRPPGHDAEVVGDEDCVFLDFGEIEEYAKRG